MKQKFISSIKLCIVCSIFSMSLSSFFALKPAKIWMGISEIASSHGASRAEQRMINMIGIADSAVWGFAVGGPAGAAVGAGVGL